MPDTVFLRRLRKWLAGKSNAETASAVRALAEDFAEMKPGSKASIDHPHTSAIFFEDLARRLEMTP